VKGTGMEEGDRAVYLRPTEYIDSENPAITALARDLAADIDLEAEAAVRLFRFVRDEIHYNAFMVSTHAEDFRASLTLERGQGYCVQKAVLLAALAPFDPAGRPFVEYLEKYEPEGDLPFDWLREKVFALWGDKRSWLTDQDSRGHVMPHGFRFRQD
jgi:hypothetical protein